MTDHPSDVDIAEAVFYYKKQQLIAEIERDAWERSQGGTRFIFNALHLYRGE